MTLLSYLIFIVAESPPRKGGILLWVLKYKLDDLGFLVKCKARLVVTRNFEPADARDNYASTPPSGSIRILIAIATVFGCVLFCKPMPPCRNPMSTSSCRTVEEQTRLGKRRIVAGRKASVHHTINVSLYKGGDGVGLQKNAAENGGDCDEDAYAA
ncbi:hypothetical protein SEPCBS57363_006039 [Sporothrix epigloea]|uniref:Uncharacterized protein n=1 Tax=Sporothrix epigloea TaxID=1892477 RepID=A0ABP0E241_9PEZI